MQENIALTNTAGKIQNQIFKKDFGSYSHLDLGYAICEKVDKEIEDCAHKHLGVFSTDFFCVVVQYATDPLLKGVLRRKFYGWPLLPDPRPMQSVFLYDHGKWKFLWALPDAWTMAYLSESTFVDHEYIRMKRWSDAWFNKNFWQSIRKEHGIFMLSEFEVNARNREQGKQFVSDDELGVSSDPFYLPEMRIKKLETMSNASSFEFADNGNRKAN